MANWIEKQESKFKKQMAEEAERLHFTAQEGSLLDRIWKGENIFSKPLLNEVAPLKIMEKRFWLSIKHKDKCLFSRRNGYQGKIIFGYSIRLRLFGRNFI